MKPYGEKEEAQKRENEAKKREEEWRRKAEKALKELAELKGRVSKPETTQQPPTEKVTSLSSISLYISNSSYIKADGNRIIYHGDDYHWSTCVLKRDIKEVCIILTLLCLYLYISSFIH